MESKKRETAQAKKTASRISAYQSLFNSKEGQIVLEDMMEAHHFKTSTFDGDQTKTIFREGERNVVLRILTLLKMDIKSINERIRLNEISE